ncbi:NAD(P)/FAD-dependent oxidoreductase [Candidatus Azambacteria bacterium]|nr:NAD(P)/FAD-dependent oxidoreductase [Candidatus Azambacteria bacterium]
MEKVKYLIIGGGVAGTTAAETIRQQDPAGSCAIVSDEPYRLYSRIMLSKPNFFLEKIPFDQIWLKQDEWYPKNNITLIAGKKATALDTAAKTVTLDDSTSIVYDKLLLATGTCVRKWNSKGADKQNVFYLRMLDDAKQIIAKVKSTRSAVVVGGGFVGFEMCEMLRLAGIDVTLIIREPHFWDPLLDKRSGTLIEAALEKGGVRIMRNSQVKEVIGGESVEGVTLADGATLPADMIVVGIGTYCRVEWTAGSGIKTNRGIVTDEYLATSAPDVWAAGDGAEFKDVILGEQIQLGNWANAQMQGRVAARNMCGAHEQFRLVSFYVTGGFGITIAFAGDIRPTEGLSPEHVEGREVIARNAADGNSFSRIILKNGKIIGATMINNTKELTALTKLIEKGADMADNKDKLSNASCDLKTLL